MQAMVIARQAPVTSDSAPLERRQLPTPVPGPGEVLVAVSVCGVCHTELDEIEGRLALPRLPVVPGHQVVGRVVDRGPGAEGFEVGDRVGIAWIHSACGTCTWCQRGDENLCPDFRGTGCHVDGGYAEYVTVPQDFAHALPAALTDMEAAPLLCAGAIGYRSLRLTGLVNGQPLGLMGFGASGHLVLRLARYLFPDSSVSVFARRESTREFARSLGAAWAGHPETRPPEPLAALIDTTPAWQPVLSSLENLAAGGRLVINAIRKDDADRECLLALDYPRHLWQEKELKSVANVTRRDVTEFLDLAARADLRPEVEEYPLIRANQALIDLKTQRARGAKVLRVA